LQKQLDAEHPKAGIAILGVNGIGHGNNAAFCEGRSLPWLQDTAEADWWANWGVRYRDVVILDRTGNKADIFNLTDHDLQDSQDFAAFKSLLLAAAQEQ
jgi:hypothetical protein